MKPPPERRSAAEVLPLLDQATAAATGQAFFDALTRNVSLALGAHCTFVARFSNDLQTASARSFWLGDQSLPPFDYALAGTPCAEVLDGNVVAYESKVAEAFPDHRRELEEIHAESYLAIPLRNIDGRVIGHFAVIDAAARRWEEADIGILRIFAARATAELEREAYEAALRQTNEQLRLVKDAAEAASRAKSEFLATMSHELRTPLNGILGYAQILKRDRTLSGEQRRGVDTIERCGEHLLALIGDILDLARIEAGRLDLHPQPFALEAFLDSVAELARMDALRSGLRFVYEMQTALPRCIEGDERRLRQILLNLLSNAVKYTDTGAVTLRASYGADTSGRPMLRLEVEDTGVGIAADQLDTIFDRFSQVGQYRESRAQSTGLGLGLGLTISRRLARAMGGDIRVHSTPGRGSCFTIEVVAEEAHPATQDSVAAASLIQGYRGRRRRILVVDDQADNRDVLHTLLASLGFTVEEAASGAAAIEACRRQPPDLIVMDLVMPGMGGMEALRNLRGLPGCDRVPALAVSASAHDQTRADSIAAGFHAFIPKPFRFDALLDTIGNVLGIEWLMRDAAEMRGASGNGTTTEDRRKVLAGIHELARRGDVRAIQARLAQLQGADDAQVERLRACAERYDMGSIRNLLTPEGDWRP